MGRKPNPNNKNYFGAEQEQAVKDYINATSPKEKNDIFKNKLEYPFTKMVESIIRRYKLYPPDEEYEETFADTLSFLMTKLSSFNPERNCKAYSYCGTVCKNYLILKINQFVKRQTRNTSYDVVCNNIENTLDYSYDNPNRRGGVANELLGGITQKIEKVLEEKKDTLTPNEVKVGLAMCNLFSSWEDLFVHIGSQKFNKSTVLLYIKEATLLSTKEIRESSKIYKKIYTEFKAELLEE